MTAKQRAARAKFKAVVKEASKLRKKNEKLCSTCTFESNSKKFDPLENSKKIEKKSKIDLDKILDLEI